MAAPAPVAGGVAEISRAAAPAPVARGVAEISGVATVPEAGDAPEFADGDAPEFADAVAPAEIRIRAPAKVNLRLVVLAREESGYHQLETVFCALRFADLLCVRAPAEARREGVELHVSGPEPGLPESNLVHRAAVAFYRESGLVPSAVIRLVKRIPAGAGLGGGSSDAAATLLALNRIHRGTLTDATLARLGAELGSDVPFFLAGAARALAWGRGERMMPLPALPPAPIIVACPPFASPTPAAYGLLAEHRSVTQATENGPDSRADAGPHSRAAGHHRTSRSTARPFTLPPAAGADWPEAARIARNDFEDVLFPRFTLLRALRDAMRNAGAVVSLLAGSGSAVFGVFADERARRTAAAALRREFPGVRVVQTWTLG